MQLNSAILLMTTRRDFIKASAAPGSALLVQPSLGAPRQPEPFPVRRITDGEHPCWFGCYDK